MRTDVKTISFDQLDPPLRAMIVYEHNDVFNVADTQPLFQQILLDTPVVEWDFGVAFFAAKDIVAAARNPQIISTDPNTGIAMGMGSRDPLIPIHVDGERHAQYRRLLEPLLTPKELAGWEEAIRALADELIDGFIAHGRVEFMSQFAAPLPGQIFLRVFGLPQSDLEFLVSIKDRILKGESIDLQAREELGCVAGDELREHLRRRLKERREEPVRDDLIGRFLTFELDGESLSDEEIINIMHLFTVAGLDTVTASLSLMVGWLAAHPEERDRLVTDPSRLPTAIEELMRVVTPVPGSGLRWAAEDTEVNGVPVKKGSLIFLCWGTANMDPETFENPLEVDLARRPNRHLSFAAGTHRCVGSHLARLELRVALEQLHRRIPDYRLDPEHEPEYVLAGVRACQTLWLTLTPAG